MAAVDEASPGGSKKGAGLRSTCLHTAAAANRASHIADWAIVDGVDELVYASHKNLVFAKRVGSRHPPASQLIATPKGYLTVVKYAHSITSGAAPRVIAASSDGYLHLYSKSGSSSSSSPSGWTLAKSWSATGSETPATKAPQFPGKRARNEGTASIQALGVLRPGVARDGGKTQADHSIFASASSDGVLKVWKIDEKGNVELKQSATLGKSRAESKTEVLPLDIAISTLPSAAAESSDSRGSNLPLLMAVAGTDGKVDFWLAEGEDLQFRRLFAISGHSDWIRSLDFCSVAQETSPTSLMLATGSQDHSVRLWRVERNLSAGANKEAAAKGELDEFDRLAMQIEDNNTEEETIATKAQSFTCEQVRWDVSLDALLSGHEHWVTGVRWAPLDGNRQPAALLSSSADNSVILWTPSSGAVKASSSTVLPAFTSVKNTEQEQDIWVSIQRFGELGSVGSAANGMYGVLWDPTVSSSSQKQAALAHGYGGALQVWGRETAAGGRLGAWKAQSGLGGHFAPATCVRWEPGGEYYITGGLDKTTRLYGCYRGKEGRSWHEMARPQTHGFEIVSLAWLSRLAFSSAGDEKIIRVLEAPQGYVKTMQTLSLAQGASEDLLAFRLPTLGHLLHPDHLGNAIEDATRRALARRSRLTIAAISPLFDGLKNGKPCDVSFEAAENFLKGCYAKAWGIAIKEGNLLFDVDVLFVGAEREEWILQRTSYGCVFTVDEPSCRLETAVEGETSELSSSGKSQPSDKEKVSAQALPQHRVIALGGTFDHLHVGHKILLSVAALCATAKIIVGVTDDSMLTKKKSAHLLEDIDARIKRVSGFLATFRAPFYDLERDVVKLQDVAGPAGTVADIDALLFTDETISGADFIDKERMKNGLNKLQRLSIGVIGAQGETEMKGKEASELAAAKVGSTAIRQWLDSKGGKGGIALDQVATLDGKERPVGASVPPLGLSNRSIYSTSSKPTDAPSESGQPVGKAQQSIAHHLTRPPVEDELHNNSLWCEVTKLYGHSLELLSLDVSVDQGLIASSCKAKSGQLAVVLIHDRNKTWDQIQQLDGHALDITRVRFSPDGRHLVSVSRDRSWRLYTKQEQEEESQEGKKEKGDAQFKLTESLEEAHTRIIYDVAWTLDSTRFATASRDHQVKVWTVGKEGDKMVSLSHTLSFTESITALAFTQGDRLAVGTEKGNAFIYDCNNEGGPSLQSFQVSCTMPAIHSESISELAWRPSSSEATASNSSMLVSSSLDGTTRSWQISS